MEPVTKNIVVDIPIVSDAKQAIEKMLLEVKRCHTESWNAQIFQWKKEYPLKMTINSGVTPEKIINTINETFSESIVVTDVGQHQMWTTQYLEMNEYKQLLTSGGLGTMGYGFPAAIGAQFGNPDKTVICISGDGGMQMNIQEMATAVAWELPLILCIFNNSCLGMVRQWQKLFYGKRYSSTCLRGGKNCKSHCSGLNISEANSSGTDSSGVSSSCPAYSPDFVKLAESYGAYGIRVENEEDIRSAFLQAMENKKAPTIIEFMIDSEEIVLPMVQGGKPLSEMILDC